MVFCLLLLSAALQAQKLEYAVLAIPENLKENANAVVRHKKVDVFVTSRKSITVKTTSAITVLNESGLSRIGAIETRDVKSIGATLYDALGFEIKKFKRKDFHEVAADDGAMISDNKRTFLDFTPVSYPFTIVYESEISDSNTAFIPLWFPLNRTNMGIERSELNITCAPELGLRYKEVNFEGYGIAKKDIPNGMSYSATNLSAFRDEAYSPSASRFLPHVLFGLDSFNLEGLDGSATTWKDFGSWEYYNLISGTDELADETKAKIIALVGQETDPIKKARIVYKYVQDKTRYVGIQLGIGGFRPMKAKDVERLGYGDCKALTNYTRSLLNVVGVPSYYAELYGDRNKMDLNPDFASVQGNHVILAIPIANDYVWLECTSQKAPFGYLGNFTDDRMALLLKPNGGELVRTSVYKDNTQMSKGTYVLDENGTIKGKVEIKSKGIQFDNRMHLSSESADERKKFYKDYFGINNLVLEKIDVSSNSENVEFLENISLNAERYGELRGNRLFFPINAFNKVLTVPQRYRARKNPFEIQRPYTDFDEVTVAIPQGFSIEAKPENIVISDKFGDYKMEYLVVDARQIVYKRSLTVKDGYYKSEEYENFRKFMEQVAKADNSKIVLVKN